MESFFRVPDSTPPSWADAWLSTMYASKPARAALTSSAHELISWDALLAEGLTCDALLRCDPRAVAAWVRTADDGCVTLKHIRNMPGGSALTASALLRAWGDRLSPPLMRCLQLDAAALESLGLDQCSVRRIDWTPARWRELFGAVPSEEVPAAPQLAQPPSPPRLYEQAYTNHSRRTIGVRVLRL